MKATIVQVLYRGRVNEKTGREHKGFRIINGRNLVKVLLKPGVNAILKEQWEAIESVPNVARLVNSGQIKVLEGEKGKPFDFGKMDIHEARTLITPTIDATVLRGWLEQEKADGNREEVVKMLEKQITHVTTDARGRPVEPRVIEMRPRIQVVEPPARTVVLQAAKGAGEG